MREYIVTLRSGQRITVKAAHRVITSDHQFVVLTDQVPTPDHPDTVAMFDRREVVSIIARDYLVSEDKVAPTHVVVDPNDDIPF